jgi:hypothetical protein
MEAWSSFAEGLPSPALSREGHDAGRRMDTPPVLPRGEFALDSGV